LQVSGGNVTLTPTVQFIVTPSTITGWTSSNGPTLLKGFPATITGTGFVPGSTVEFGWPGANGTQTQIDTQNGQNGRWVTATVPMNAVDGPITIVRPGGDPIVSSAIADFTEGSITSLSTYSGFAPGYNVTYLQTGSEVDIAGYGFQQGAKVIFGDPSTSDPQKLLKLANTPGIGATPITINGGGTWLSVDVPRYAVDGPVEVIEPDGTPLKATQVQDFVVSNYRDTFGFSFQNFNFNITWDLLKGEYGGKQVDYTVLDYDTGIPTWQALLVWGFAAWKLNGKGACYGMALTSVLLSEYQPGLINGTNGLPNGAAPTVFNLQQNGPLTTMIEQNHLAQFSAQIIAAFKNWQIANSQNQIDAGYVYNLIAAALQQGDHPIVSLQSGANHSVVAYDLEPGPKQNGDYYIDVYDPDRPFDGLDAQEHTDPTKHMNIEQASRIYVDPSSGWSFMMNGGGTYSGGFGTLEVLPAGLVAGGVTFPTTLDGVLKVILGSSGRSAPASRSGTPTPIGPRAAGLTAARATPAAPGAPRPSGSPSPLDSGCVAPLSFESSDVVAGMPVPLGPGTSPWAFGGQARKIAYQGIKRSPWFAR
jgi:hypothetical protein